MHSVCFVVLPEGMTADDTEAIARFTERQIRRYDARRKVPLHKHYWDEGFAQVLLEEAGVSGPEEYAARLQHAGRSDEGADENGLFCLTTDNSEAIWDWYRILYEETAPGRMLADRSVYSVVTPDGTWHSLEKYGYMPVLDRQRTDLHPDNAEPYRRWRAFVRLVIQEYGSRYFAVLDVHS